MACGVLRWHPWHAMLQPPRVVQRIDGAPLLWFVFWLFVCSPTALLSYNRTRTHMLPYIQRCQTVLGPFRVSGSGAEAKPGSCPGCQAEDSFKIDQEQTMYRNYQKITLQVMVVAVRFDSI